MRLSPDICEQMDELCAEGDRLMDEDNPDAALAAYRAAENLIPDPKQDWEASTWIYTAIGDALFSTDSLSEALKAYQTAVMSPDGLGNPYIHLMLGECQFELGDRDEAADEFARAYMADGDRIFENEDSKYFEFLKTRLVID